MFYLPPLRRLHKIHILCASIFFIFGHQVETYGVIPMISVPQFFKNRLEDVTNFYKTIFLPIVVQV